MSAESKDEILFEFTRMDNALRVCAVDPATGVEVVTVLPANTNQDMAMRQALNKLRWRLKQGASHTVRKGAGDKAVTRQKDRYI